jgi:hypothetical protein
MTAKDKEVAEVVVSDTSLGDASFEVIEIESFAREKKPVPKGHKYRIRIDKTHYVVDVPHMTGAEILGLAGKSPEGWLLSEKVHGQMLPVEPVQDVDFTAPGVERFATIAKEVQEGEGGVGVDFLVLDEDVEFLEGQGLSWQAVAQPDCKRIVVRNYPLPPGYTNVQVDMFVILPAGYPDTQIDMVYFYPPLSRIDGKGIPSVFTNVFENKEWQGWSRHRTPKSEWRQGIDNLGTHLLLVDSFLRAELNK